jgi:phosphotransferase system enzyme I (PtsI)
MVAHDLSPADVIQFKQHHFGVPHSLGGVTSHTAIVARSLTCRRS